MASPEKDSKEEVKRKLVSDPIEESIDFDDKEVVKPITEPKKRPSAHLSS